MATGVSLAKYKIPKDPAAFERHIFTSNDRDEKELWHKAYGLRTLLESIANYHKVPLGHNQLRKYTHDPRVLLDWVVSATADDLTKLRAALARFEWASQVYNYLLTCWLVYRTKYQSTLVCRIGASTSELTAKQQVNALNAHLQELRKFAVANNFSLLWAFDHDDLPSKKDGEAPRQRVNTFHVHVYCSHKALFTYCREASNLLPFVPRHTVLSATVPVRMPTLREDGRIDWVYYAPSNSESPFEVSVPNTLAYVAAKTAGLHTRQSKPNVEGGIYTVAHTNRTAKYVCKVVTNSDPKGKPRKHWGFLGFGIKGTKHELI